MVSVYCIVTCAGLTTNFSFSLIINAQVTIQMGLILQLLQIVLISTQLLKEATTTTNATATAVTASAITSRTEILNTGIATNVAQTSSPSVNDTILTRQMSLSSSALHKPSFSQSRETTQSASTTLNTTTTTRGFSASSQWQISSDHQTSPLSTPKAMNTTSSVDAGTTAVSHLLSQPKSVSQSTPSADLNSTQSKASSYITGVPNQTHSINSSYGTSSMIFTNSGSATPLVTPTTTEQTSSPSVNDITPNQQVSPSSGVLHKLSSSQLGSTPKAMNATSSVDAGTTAVSHVLSQPKSVSQSTPSADLNSTQSKASSYITGVPNQTLSINSSYGTSLMILTNSGSATTQAVYFTSDHPTKESSSLLVAHTTTDSFTKLTSAISGINFSRQETVLTLIKPCQMLIIKHRLVCLTLTTDGAPFALYVEDGYCGGGGMHYMHNNR